METIEDLQEMAKRFTWVPFAPKFLPLGATGHLTRGKNGKRVIIRFNQKSLYHHVDGLAFTTMDAALAHVEAN
jgi:hypothetical protein